MRYKAVSLEIRYAGDGSSVVKSGEGAGDEALCWLETKEGDDRRV